MPPASLINEYLIRCSQVEGEIDGLVPSGSSDDSRSSDDDSDESYDQEDSNLK